MKQVQLIFSKKVLLENEQSMQLDYCLMESISEDEHATPYYGVQISKYLGDTVEKDEIAGLSSSREEAVAILEKLYQFDVTPISMVEIVDELAEQVLLV
ncbi:hypothetical protein HNQ56_003686 [Anaerotaenia torta]|uniref:DUF6514 family protein n=1 Tax=Anaerotaenia torta TaxID=433293 RepID=UPI003D1EE780